MPEPSIGQDSQRAGAHEGWGVNWATRLAALGLSADDIVTEEWEIEARNAGDAGDLTVTYERRLGALHEIWLTSTVAQAAYDVTSWITLPSPGGGADFLRLPAKFTITINP